jgi:hypothetical protein
MTDFTIICPNCMTESLAAPISAATKKLSERLLPGLAVEWEVNR